MSRAQDLIARMEALGNVDSQQRPTPVPPPSKPASPETSSQAQRQRQLQKQESSSDATPPKNVLQKNFNPDGSMKPTGEPISDANQKYSKVV